MTRRRKPQPEPTSRTSWLVSNEPVPEDYQLKLQQRPYAPASVAVIMDAFLRELPKVKEPSQ